MLEKKGSWEFSWFIYCMCILMLIFKYLDKFHNNVQTYLHRWKHIWILRKYCVTYPTALDDSIEENQFLVSLCWVSLKSCINNLFELSRTLLTTLKEQFNKEYLRNLKEWMWLSVLSSITQKVVAWSWKGMKWMEPIFDVERFTVLINFSLRKIV